MMDLILLRFKGRGQISKRIYLTKFFLLFSLLIILPSPLSAQLVLTSNGNINISATVIDPNAPVPSNGHGSSSSGGGTETAPTDVTFSGLAYPNAKIILLLSGTEVANAVADPSAEFSLELSNLTPGIKVFSVVAVDPEGIRSILLTIPITIQEKTSTTISNLFIPPTLSTDATSKVRGEKFLVHGYSAPSASVTLRVDSKDNQDTMTSTAGLYSGSIATDNFPIGEHSIQALGATTLEKEKVLSGLGKIVYFFIVLTPEQVVAEKSDVATIVDINNDKVINIVDFSILAYWYKKPTPPANFDFNGDGKVTIADFSILAYYWNG